MPFQLPRLPFEPGALAPHVSAETISYHYGKHHQAYVEKTNKLLHGSLLRDSSLEEIVRDSNGELFNNSAQAWNHAFFWHCLGAESGSGAPSGALDKALRESFESREKFLEKLAESAAANFGSGWTWLVRDEAGKLSVLNTSNADTPITKSLVPLLVVDVWEHAYYIDYRNARPRYLEAFQRIIRWSFASERFESPEAFNATREMRAARAA